MVRKSFLIRSILTKNTAPAHGINANFSTILSIGVSLLVQLCHSRPSLAASETTHSVQAGHNGVQVPSSHGAVVPSRHVHSCVVYNWSSTSPFCRPSRSDNSTQSIGVIWITQLRHFRPFDLELVATDCS